MNGGNPREDLIQHKNPKLAMKLAPEWKELGLNHLEGRTAGFSPMATVLRRRETNRPTAVFGPPQILRPEEEPYRNLRDCYAPLVWQCRFSGIEVLEQLWRYKDSAKAGNTETIGPKTWRRRRVHGRVQPVDTRLPRFVAGKVRVEPGKYRAYGDKAPGHRWADTRLWLREMSMRVGKPPPIDLRPSSRNWV